MSIFIFCDHGDDDRIYTKQRPPFLSGSSRATAVNEIYTSEANANLIAFASGIEDMEAKPVRAR